MNARRDELIALAAETLHCEGQCAHGHYIYHDDPTGWWMVTDNSMAALGKALERWDAVTAHHEWCRETTAMEVDLDLIVLDYEIAADTDMDALISECEAMDPPDIMTVLVLKFARDHVLDTVRINAEIDRDHDESRDGTVDDAEAWYDALAIDGEVER